MKTEDVSIKKMPFPQDDICIEYAKLEETARLAAFLNEVFDLMYAFLPIEEKLRRLIMDKRILVCYYKKMAGMVNMDICRNTAWIRHIAVVSGFRGGDRLGVVE